MLAAGSADGVATNARVRVDLERLSTWAHLLPMFTCGCVRECVMRLCNTPEITREDGTTLSDQRWGSRNPINGKEMQFHIFICSWIYWMLHSGCRGVDPICHNTCANYSAFLVVWSVSQFTLIYTVVWPHRRFLFSLLLFCSFSLSQYSVVTGQQLKELRAAFTVSFLSLICFLW